MSRFLKFGGLLALFLIAGNLVAVTATESVAQPPVRDRDYAVSAWLSPNNPSVGDDYSLFITVYNNASRNIHFRAHVTSLPDGDRLRGAASQERSVGPGGSATFQFPIYCGVVGGNVRYEVNARW